MSLQSCFALIATCALVSLMEFMTSESMDFASVNELTSALEVADIDIPGLFHVVPEISPGQHAVFP